MKKLLFALLLLGCTKEVIIQQPQPPSPTSHQSPIKIKEVALNARTYNPSTPRTWVLDMWGQSNVVNYAGSALPVLDSINYPNVWTLNIHTFKLQKGLYPTAYFTNGLSGPLVYVIQQLATTYPSDKFIAVQYAIAGTGMDTWNSNASYSNNYGAHLMYLDAALMQLPSKPDIFYSTFVQGEKDAGASNTANLYFRYEYLTFADFSNYYNELGYPLNGIIDTRLGSWENTTNCPYFTTINSAKDLVSQLYHTTSINTDGVAHNADNEHYSNPTGIQQLATLIVASIPF